MNWRLLRNVILKAMVLFLVFNLVFAASNPVDLGKISAYNLIFPGRSRFPFGENPAQSYNLSLFNLDAMFASHVIDGGLKPVDEYRVLIIGDSSVWGTLLSPEETLAGQLNTAHLTSCDGRIIHVYNLGYPTISLFKDLMILNYAMRYQPDLVVWPVTLEAFPVDKQLTSPIVANNTNEVRALIEKYSLSLDPDDPLLVQPNIWNQTIVGQRRNLADLFRLQMYGVIWAATGIDQFYPPDYPRAQTDFDADLTFHGMQPPVLDESLLAFDLLGAGLSAAGETPVLLVNEPMLISTGTNSDIRYNFFYPRWVYDQYRQNMAEHARANGWNYLDLWDIVPANEFTNSAIHLTPVGEATLAERVGEVIIQQGCR